MQILPRLLHRFDEQDAQLQKQDAELQDLRRQAATGPEASGGRRLQKAAKSSKGNGSGGKMSKTTKTKSSKSIPTEPDCDFADCDFAFEKCCKEVVCDREIGDVADPENDEDKRRLTLGQMTDRFNEDGSVHSFVDSLGYEVDLNSGVGEKENALEKEDCEGIMSLVGLRSDSDIKEPVNYEDIHVPIDKSDLVSVIGKVRLTTMVHVCSCHLPFLGRSKIPDLTFICLFVFPKIKSHQDKFNALLDLHKEVVGTTIPLEAIKIRLMRGPTNSVTDAFFEYSTTESGHECGTKLSSVIVALNDNSSVKKGGELYYLREDGPVLAYRAQGKAFAHSYNVLHGVSPHVGDRVSLILQFNHDLELEDVGGRKLTEETKRGLGASEELCVIYIYPVEGFPVLKPINQGLEKDQGLNFPGLELDQGLNFPGCSGFDIEFPLKPRPEPLP